MNYTCKWFTLERIHNNKNIENGFKGYFKFIIFFIEKCTCYMSRSRN